jgi:hypothetical protein
LSLASRCLNLVLDLEEKKTQQQKEKDKEEK